MLDSQAIQNKLKQALSSQLPGISSYLKLAPVERIEGIKSQQYSKNAKPSAVLIILFKEEKQLKIIFILRSVYEGVHSGQISFPGGKKDEEDDSLIETALREVKEEIGINIGEENILGKLSNLYIPNSNFLVNPYVAFVEKLDKLIPDSEEVQQIYKISLNNLLDENAVQTKEVLFLNKQSITAPCFYVNDLVIWGATAMILNELLDIIKSNKLTKLLA